METVENPADLQGRPGMVTGVLELLWGSGKAVAGVCEFDSGDVLVQQHGRLEGRLYSKSYQS